MIGPQPRHYKFWAAACGALIFLSGCFHRVEIKGPGDEAWGVRVKWYGHSCFSVEDSAGRIFLIDPFDETVGYPLPRLQPDALLVTHAHFDHDYFAFRHFGEERVFPSGEKDGRPGDSEEPPSRSGRGPRGADPRLEAARRARMSLVEEGVLLSSGVNTMSGIEVTGIPGFHDDQQGRRNGGTYFYVWNMGGLRLAHLGDVGQRELTPEQLRSLGKVDVLFVPVGGETTVDAAAAASIVRAVNPRIAVPMHYGNEMVRFFEFDPLDKFTAFFSRVEKLKEDSFRVDRETLPAELTVYVPVLPESKK